MNPNHPHYAGLGGGPNLNLLDNMLMAAGFQVIHLIFGIFFCKFKNLWVALFWKGIAADF